MKRKNKFISFVIILLMNFLGYSQVQLTIDQNMVTNVNSDTTVNIADEQNTTGNPQTKWDTSWSPTAQYPQYAIVNFNGIVNISSIHIFDMNGIGDMIVERKENGNWIEVFTDPLNHYLAWNIHPTNITTTAIRITKTNTSAIIGEIKFFGSNTTTYDSTLSNLSVDGLTISNFNPSTTSYLVTLPIGTSLVPSVTAETTDSNATLAITNATGIPGATAIVVTAQDGTSTTYNVNFVLDTGNSGVSKIPLLPIMITDESNTDAYKLVDEQSEAGDPANNTGGAPTSNWFAGWNTANYPASAYIDLGQSYQVTKIYLRDINDIGNFKVYYGTPNNWTLLFTDSLEGYNTWNEHNGVTTRYLRFVKESAQANVSEVVIYGIAGNGSNDATLSDLLIDGNSVNNFTSSTTNYNISLPVGTNIVPTVVGIPNNSNASVNVSPTSSLPGDTTITVTSQDGTETNYYVVHFTVASSGNVNYIHLNTERNEWLNTPIFDSYEATDFDAFWQNKLATLPTANPSWNGGSINIGGNNNGIGEVEWNNATNNNKKPLLVVLPSAGAPPSINSCPSTPNFIVASAMNTDFTIATVPNQIKAVLAIQQMIKNILASGKSDGRVFVIGKSQGGGLGLITTALCSQVVETFVSVPAMTGFTGTGNASGAWPGYNPNDINVNYLDACNHAKRITKPVTFSLGYGDNVTWYRGQNTAAKNIAAGTVYLYHNIQGHNDPQWWNEGVTWLQDVLARNNTNNNEDITVTIHFNNVPNSAIVEKAALKYNKNFAYSFTLDDSKKSQFTNAYPILAGGTNETGYFYTDGCGNDIPFEAGLAVNAGKIATNNTYLSWNNLQTLFDNGWEVMNHSYTHASWQSNINYNQEIINNNQAVQSHLGYEMTHFVVPSNDTNYITPAFSNGMLAVYNQSFSDYTIKPLLQVDGNIALTEFKRARKWVGDSDFSYSLVDNAANLSNNNNHYWYNDFAHEILPSGDFTVNELKNYMNHIQTNYGKGGSDTVWMASIQEVYEYLAIRETAIINYTVSGNDLVLTIDLSAVPNNLLNKALTLHIDSNIDFNGVDVTGANLDSFKGTGTNKIINLDWSTFSGNKFSNDKEKITLGLEPIVYPNPTSSIVKIISKNTIQKIKVFNSLKQLVMVSLENTSQLDLSNLKKDIYILQITDTNGNVWNRKIIKK